MIVNNNINLPNIHTYIHNKYYGINFKAGFSKIEQEAIDAVRAYTQKHGVETARIIKNGKDITDKFSLKETKTGVSLIKLNTSELENQPDSSIKQAYIFAKIIYNAIKTYIKAKINLRNAIFIHSHPQEAPFSAQDVLMGIGYRFKKMVVVTPSGKTCVMEGFDKNRKVLNQEGYKFKIGELQRSFNYINEYGVDFAENPELFEPRMKAATEALDTFVKNTGIHYEPNIK